MRNSRGLKKKVIRLLFFGKSLFVCFAFSLCRRETTKKEDLDRRRQRRETLLRALSVSLSLGSVSFFVFFIGILKLVCKKKLLKKKERGLQGVGKGKGDECWLIVLIFLRFFMFFSFSSIRVSSPNRRTPSLGFPFCCLLSLSLSRCLLFCCFWKASSRARATRRRFLFFCL